jgi:uncharacterized protein YbjT (DUF2867 family)
MQMSGNEDVVLVLGATGMQGGAVARALRSDGVAIRALTRDARSASAKTLGEAGADVVEGDLDDVASLRAACEGVTSVFSVFTTSPATDAGREQRHAKNLVAAASAAGVRQLIHSSVSGTGWRASHPGLSTFGTDRYWDDKEAVEATVREAAPISWVILKPAFFMENLLPPKRDKMFPGLASGALVTASSPEAVLALLAGVDLAAAVRAALREPRRFAEAEIELAGDAVTFEAMAETLAEVTGMPVSVRFAGLDELSGSPDAPMWAPTQAWLDDVGYPARPATSAGFGIHPTSFLAWSREHRDELRSGISPSGAA